MPLFVRSCARALVPCAAKWSRTSAQHTSSGVLLAQLLTRPAHAPCVRFDSQVVHRSSTGYVKCVGLFGS